MVGVDSCGTTIVGAPRIDSSHGVKEEDGRDMGHDARKSLRYPRRWALSLFLSIAAFVAMLVASAGPLLALKPFSLHTTGMTFASLCWCVGVASKGFRSIHVVMQSFACIIAVLGYIGIYIAHTSRLRRLHDDHPDSSSIAHNDTAHHHHSLAIANWHDLFEKPWTRLAHVLIGYPVLILAIVQICSGFVKCRAAKPSLKWHGKVGQVLLLGASLNCVIGVIIFVSSVFLRGLLCTLFCIIAVTSLSVLYGKDGQQSFMPLD